MTNIILCGGSGTRLWPMSQTLMPKQFVKLFKNQSLFQLTIERNAKVCNKNFIVKNTEQYFLALDQLEENSTFNIKNSTFLLEPVGRNTAPAIALACFANLHVLFQKNDVIDTVMPSKLLGMMASATPSVVTGSIESEVAKVFDKSQGGYFFDSDNFDDVVQSIENLSIDKELTSTMGKDARTYIIEHFSATKVLSNFEEKLKEVIYA